MNHTPPSAPASDDSDTAWDRIADRIATWRSARAAGRPVSAAELCHRCPELLPRVAAGIAAAEQMEAAVGGERGATDAPARDPFQYSAGEVVDGRYVLECEVGQGGFAVVWRGRAVADGAPVAVKLPLGPHPDPDKDIEEMFRHEAEVARAVRGRNVVPVYRHGRHRDAPYIAFKLVEEGESLHARIERVGRVGPTEARSIAWHIASALAYAHEQGLIHRDLNPKNVLIDPGGWVYLIDFGIAVTLGEGAAGRPRATGTESYMAPEQLTGAPLDPSCDVYLFGIILYQLLTGRLPARHEPCADPVLSYFAPLLRKCLAPEPKDRYRSGRELLSDLRPKMPPGTVPGGVAVLAAASPPAPPPTPAVPLTATFAGPAPAPRRASLVPAAIIAIAVVVALAIGGLSLVGARADHVRSGPVAVVLIAACLALGVAVVRPQRTALGYLVVACVGLVVASVIGGAAESLLRSITAALNGALRLP